MPDKPLAEISRYSVANAFSPALPGLVSVIRRLCIVRSIEEIMQTVTPAARHLLLADGITFVLREHDKCFYAEEDAISPLWKGRRFPLDACISGWCMTERKAAAIEDIYADPRIPHDAYRPTFVRSLAMVPVRQDEPIAAMGAYWRNRRTISRSELDMLQTIANAAGLALANVELKREQDKVGRARHELTHRMRNLMAVVQALAQRGLRSASSLEEFGETFSGRLQALSRAQELLDGAGEAGSDLREIIRDQLLLGENSGRIRCSGPDVYLAADEAFDLGLVLHELGTNARKYGALSCDSGVVEISWKIDTGGSRPLLALTWIERGGPLARPPSGTGLGSVLVRQAFVRNGGSTSVRYDPQGFECRMRLALP